MRNIAVLATGLFAALTTTAQAQSPTALGTFSDWSAYSHNGEKGKECYIIGQPTDMLPKNVNRDPAYFLVTARPADGVKNEPSVIIGYPFKEGSSVSVDIGSDQFSMFTKDDGAWVESVEDENDLVAAMKRGATMVVKGTSRRGTLTTDTYSLSGVTAGMEKVAQACS